MADARRSLARGISERIERMILAGELQPGTRINESHLSATLRVSRAPVREALRHLERHGLVEVRPNLGAYVCTLDERDISELYEIRIALEGLLGARAAVRVTAAQVEELDAVLADLARCRDAASSHDYYLANQRFHAVVVAAADSRQLEDCYAGVQKRLALYRIGSQADAADMRASWDEHAGIVAAVRAGDAAAAGAALVEHCRRGVARHLRRSAANP